MVMVSLGLEFGLGLQIGLGMDLIKILQSKFSSAGHLIITRRVPIQRAVERDEIPYPYKVHDTMLRPHNFKIYHSRA